MVSSCDDHLRGWFEMIDEALLFGTPSHQKSCHFVLINSTYYGSKGVAYSHKAREVGHVCDGQLQWCNELIPAQVAETYTIRTQMQLNTNAEQMLLEYGYGSSVYLFTYILRIGI
jgi:hypothetical protein